MGANSALGVGSPLDACAVVARGYFTQSALVRIHCCLKEYSLLNEQKTPEVNLSSQRELKQPLHFVTLLSALGKLHDVADISCLPGILTVTTVLLRKFFFLMLFNELWCYLSLSKGG